MKRKSIAGLIVIAVIVAVVMFMGCAAPMVTPIPQQKQELSLGEAAMLDHIRFTVAWFGESYEYNTSEGETIYPEEKAKFLWVYVKAKNVGEWGQEIPHRVWGIHMLYKGEKHTTSGTWGSEFVTGPIGGKVYPIRRFIYPNVTEEGLVHFGVPEGIDLSQVKIRVRSTESLVPYIYEHEATWVLVKPILMLTPSPSPTPTLSPTPSLTPTPEEGVLGFEAVFAIAGLLAVTYLLRRRK